MIALKTAIFGATLAYVSANVVHAQEREWMLDAAEADVFLVFGVAETNDVGVSFWCKIGTQKVSVFTTLPLGIDGTTSIPQVALSVGGKAEPLIPVVNTESTPATIEAPLEPQTKILDALQSAERFELTIGTHQTTYPLAGADIAGLLRMCAKQPDLVGQP